MDKMKKKINIQKAEFLLEKYYEGNTTVQEEQWLHKFLQQKDLPAQFEADCAIFGYFGEKKKASKHVHLISVTKWVGVAAVALIAVLLSLRPFGYDTNATNYAYIDGKKVQNVNIIKQEALLSLRGIAASEDEVMKSLQNLSDNDIVRQQLEMFKN